jgi:uncharacterized protein YjbJ (UPF0337 family)
MKVVNRDQAKGKANEIKGRVREAVGKATGNQELAAKGKGDQTKGKSQQVVGDLKDAATKAKNVVKNAGTSPKVGV